MNALKWWFCIAFFPLILATTLSTVVTETSKDVQPLSAKIDSFKTELHRLLEGSRIRKKRQIQGSIDPTENQMHVGNAAEEELPYLSDYKLTFWTRVEHNFRHQVLVGTQEGHLILFEISDTDDRSGHIVAVSYEEQVAIKAKSFSHFDEQWFIILQSARNQTWIRLYLKVGRGLEQRQSISLAGETDFDLVTVKGIHYIVVTTFQRSINQASLFLYHWTQTQFDVIATKTVYGPRSIACWVMDGTLYMVLVQKVEEFHYGSPVYLYNSKDERGLFLQQMLSIYGPIKVLHFYVSSSHYIMFIGSQNAAIYWWSSNQFLLWQTIEDTAHAVDASILELANGEVVLVIVLKEEVLFATLDSSGHYIVSFTMKFSGSSLSSFQFMYSGHAYYALALFAASYTQNAQSIWKLTIKPYFVPTGSSLDSLRQCLNDVSEILDDRQGEMNSIHIDLSRVWLKNKDQKVTAEVFIEGKTSSNERSIVSEILVVTDHKILPESSLPEVDRSVTRLKYIVDDIQQNAQTSVRKSVQQNITGKKHFQDSLFIPSLNLKSTNQSIPINGVPVSRINDYALRLIGEQQFPRPVLAANIYGLNVLTEHLNGIKTNDFLLLKDDQHVTTDMKFSGIQVGDIYADTVNSIPVSHFITKSGEQTISDLKNFAHLQSDVIDVHGQTNGEILREFTSKIVKTHTDDELKGPSTLTDLVHIKGDIFLTGLLNGNIDLSQLVEKSVTKNGKQDLKGPFTFDSPVTIQGNLAIHGSINNINLKRLLTLSTDQTIHGSMMFKKPITIQNDLDVNFLNGLSLRDAAVRRISDPQFLTGMKVFIPEITVDFLDMTEFKTLDGVDPSLLVQDIVKHKEGVVKQDHTVFHNAIVLGNVTAVDGINGIDVFDLPNNVWLKSIPQVIDVPIIVKKVLVKDDLEVNVVNTVHLDTDLIHSYGDETIISLKYFEQNVMVSRNVKATAGAMINGMDIISFKTELDEFVEEGTVHGKKVLSHLEIHGDLDASTLNNYDIFSNIMLPHAYQEVSAPVVFPSELTLVQDNLLSDTVWFNSFNSVNLHGFLEGAISKTTPKQTIKNKVFSKLRATTLSLPENNTINGIPISGLLGRVVTLNTPQEIMGDKAFFRNIDLKSLTIVNLNGKELSKLVKEVVLEDEPMITSNKKFIGSFRAQNLLANQPINGIDINRMSRNVFYKSKGNEIKSPMIFKSGIDVNKLVAGLKINGIDWDDLVFTSKDETVGQMWLLSRINVLSDIFITGLLNGCDLLQLQQNALYSNKTTQLIQEELTIESIEVIGNVHIKDVVNKVPVEDLLRKLILVNKDQVLTSDINLGSGIKATNINIAGMTDNMNLAQIINDAVRNSQPQEIRGYKKFNSFTTDLLDTSNLFVKDYLDAVNINDLYKSIVWKRGHQVIEGEKIFKDMEMNVATIQGHLNGLSLPHDVVKTDASEHITSPIFFMSDLILAANLTVHGNLDGANISSLVQDRVTLRTRQDVYSHLSFQTDAEIHGNLKVDGTINEVPLELAVKTMQNVPLSGYKVFTTDFHVIGPLNASSVNGYSVQSLEQSTFKRNEEEFVKDLQVFDKPLKVESHLFADWINSILFSDITSKFVSLVSNFKGTLKYLEELSYGFVRQLSQQIDVVEDRISRFAYLILVQEINLGPTVKILQGYRLEHSTSKFSHSMVIWTSRKHCSYLEKCCHEEFSHWMRVTRSGHLMVDSDPEPGRLYPIHNPAPVTTDKDFFMWTNATGYQPKWCRNNTDEKMLLASFTGLKYLEVFMDIRNSPSLSDVKSFRQGHLYFVAGFYYDRKEDTYRSAVVYIFNEMRREWSEHQILPSFGVLSLDVAYYVDGVAEELLLAVGTGAGSHSSVYKWNDVEHEFALLQKIPSRYVTSTVWLKHGATQMLAMANVEDWPSKEAFCSDLISGGEVNIYTYDKKLKWIQSIPLSGVVSLVHFNLEGDTFLAAASSKLQTVYIYEWKGYAGFSLVQSMFVGEVTHLNTYRIGDDLYVTVATASGPAKVLKVVLQGRHTVTTILQKEVLPDPQKDEAGKDKKPGC